MSQDEHSPMSENDSLSDELLSAYVDGELTGEQLADVEQRLANDAQARQLVDDLRALSENVKSLPRESVGEDLRESIMRRAEQAMLLGDGAENRLPPTEGHGGRRWAWAAMALAATLLLSMVLPSVQQEEQPVANAKQAPKERQLKRGEASFEAAEIASESDSAGMAEDIAGQQPAADFDDDRLAAADGSNQLAIQDEPAMAKSVPLAESAPSLRSQGMRSRATAAPSGNVSGLKGGFGGGAGGEFGGAIGGGALVAAPQLTCEVHITLGDGANSAAEIDRMLQQSGIVRQREDREFAANESIVTDGDSTQRSQAVDQQEGSEDSTKLFLVEAPLENVERALAACSSDAFHCPTIQVVDGDVGSDDLDSESADDSQQTVSAVDQLRRWERDRDDASQEFGTDQAKIDVSERKRIDTAKLLADKKSLEVRRPGKLAQSRATQSARVASGREPAESNVRVLFVLQPAADLRGPVTVESEDDSPVDR